VGYISLIPCRHHLGITHIPDEIHDLLRWIDWRRDKKAKTYSSLHRRRVVKPEFARSLATSESLEKQGYSEESITKMTLSIVAGLTGFLFNCPLDMTIERYIRNTFPSLQPAQFLSLRGLALEAAQTNTNPQIRQVTPRKLCKRAWR
jgi:hypothetical protein